MAYNLWYRPQLKIKAIKLSSVGWDIILGFDHLEALGELGTWCLWSVDPEAGRNGMRSEEARREATVVILDGSPVWRNICNGERHREL